MSDLPVRREKNVFPNPGVSPEEWYLTAQSSPLTKFAYLLPLTGGLAFGGIMLAFYLIHHIPVLTLNFADAIIGAVSWVGIIIFAAIETLITNRVQKKRDSYRRENAQLLIDTLANQGWTIDSKKPIDTLIENDFPYFHSQENSFRYKTYQKDIQAKVIEWTFELRDDKAEILLKADAKQKQIALLTEKYEKENGVLSPEKKATFQNALKMTL